MIFLGLAENSIQLVPDGTIFLHIAIILIMIFVLNATLFKPINRILEERERQTRGRSGETGGILRRVEEGLSNYERTLREARAEGYRLMEQERTRAMTERQHQLNAVREEVGRSLEEQKETIRVQTEDARKTLQEDSRRLAADIGEHILQRPVSDATVSSVS
ncbi:MAG: ATP synthase F0 subunit B [Acidobacteria bacterium]|nr:ATP synthase F0 subunit B [Acidobacteriota bacterium]